MGREGFHVGLWLPRGGGREGQKDCYGMAFTSTCCTSPRPGPTLETGYRFPMGQSGPESRDKISSTTPNPCENGGVRGGRTRAALCLGGRTHFLCKGRWEQLPDLERGLLVCPSTGTKVIPRPMLPGNHRARVGALAWDAILHSTSSGPSSGSGRWHEQLPSLQVGVDLLQSRCCPGLHNTAGTTAPHPPLPLPPPHAVP